MKMKTKQIGKCTFINSRIFKYFILIPFTVLWIFVYKSWMAKKKKEISKVHSRNIAYAHRVNSFKYFVFTS